MKNLVEGISIQWSVVPFPDQTRQPGQQRGNEIQCREIGPLESLIPGKQIQKPEIIAIRLRNRGGTQFSGQHIAEP